MGMRRYSSNCPIDFQQTCQQASAQRRQKGVNERLQQPSAEGGLQGGELACLGSAEDVPACEEMGYGPGLHLGHVHEAHLLDGLLRLGRQLQGGKLCVAHDPAHCRSMPLHAINQSSSLGLKQVPSCELMCMWDVELKQANAVVIIPAQCCSDPLCALVCCLGLCLQAAQPGHTLQNCMFCSLSRHAVQDHYALPQAVPAVGKSVHDCKEHNLPAHLPEMPDTVTDKHGTWLLRLPAVLKR